MSTTHRLLGAVAVLLLLIAAGPESAHAQKKYAAFIHGFAFEGPDACVKEEGGERWKASGTPDLWKKDRIIDGYVLLKYCDADLYNKTTNVLQDLTKQLTPKGKNVQWLLVGHSQGGIVARLLHEHLKKTGASVDVRGVLTLASPMQGARPARLSYGRRPGYKNIAPVMDKFMNDVYAGPRASAKYNPIMHYINFKTLGLGRRALDIVMTNYYWKERGELGQRINDMNYRKRSAEAIGPNGRIIKRINAAVDPRRHLSIIGAERALMAARLSSAGLEPQKLSLKVSSFAQFGIGAVSGDVADVLFFAKGRTINPGDEAQSVRLFQELKRQYRWKADKYRVRRWFGMWCLMGDCKKYRSWKRGRQALSNIDRTHAKLIDSYRTVRRTGRRYVCENNRFKASSVGASAKYLNPSHCYYKTYTYYTTIPDKSDGLLGTRTCTWGPNQNPDDRRDNFLFGDSGRGLGGGTGYNHAEVVYAKRRYDSKDDPGLRNNAFRKGQLNPTTREAREWITRRIFLK
jgi:pimeloyl-ACP methyl ester carboxylesterase